MKLKFLLVCLLATTLFNGCKKDEEEPTTTPTTSTNKTLLIDKNWKLTAYTVNPAYNLCGTPMTNLLGCVPPCSLDDITVYTTTNTYTIDEGASKCSAGDPQTKESGTWAFNSGETTITRTPSVGSAKEHTIVTLNATTLTLNESLTVGATTYVFTRTYTKQ